MPLRRCYWIWHTQVQYKHRGKMSSACSDHIGACVNIIFFRYLKLFFLVEMLENMSIFFRSTLSFCRIKPVAQQTCWTLSSTFKKNCWRNNSQYSYFKPRIIKYKTLGYILTTSFRRRSHDSRFKWCIYCSLLETAATGAHLKTFITKFLTCNTETFGYASGDEKHGEADKQLPLSMSTFRVIWARPTD